MENEYTYSTDRNAHHLIPADSHLPELYKADNGDPMVWVKLFTPDSSWTWYLTEYSETAPDGTPRLAFGLVDGWEPELGYISLDELTAVRGGLGLRVERDLYWLPRRLSAVRAELAA